MDAKNILTPKGHIIFDHDGTLVKTDVFPTILFKGMHELLSELKSLGFELYVWTSRPRRSTLESLKKFDIQNLFTEIYCYDDGIPKPSPMGLNQLTEGFAKDKILHIGDSRGDLEGANAYGIEVVFACWNDPSQIDEFNDMKDYSAIDINALREIIKGKFNV